MFLKPSDPDIATLYRRIKQGRLDLQPNFQRGEVWGRTKKQRLVDSIIRNWHIPPIHIIESRDSDKQEVLDGQQRLAAIRDFLDGEFPVNGRQDPFEQRIADLDGQYWGELPPDIKTRFEEFTIRVLTVSDYKPEEPGELFYRLNLPTNLTSAEQRNAYFGEARQQVKGLAEFMEDCGLSSQTLGFSNSRMAYDDVIAKFLVTLELGTLQIKITANTITSRYRDEAGFASSIVNAARHCLDALHQCIFLADRRVRLNKATIHSWLVFLYRYRNSFNSHSEAYSFFNRFEQARDDPSFDRAPFLSEQSLNPALLRALFEVYKDRSSSRIADISSVVLRDLCLWIFYIAAPDHDLQADPGLKPLKQAISSHEQSVYEHPDEILQEIAKSLDWGRLL